MPRCPASVALFYSYFTVGKHERDINVLKCLKKKKKNSNPLGEWCEGFVIRLILSLFPQEAYLLVNCLSLRLPQWC